MKNSARKILGKLLILIMAIGPVQVTMAIDLDQCGQAIKCQDLQVLLPDAVVNSISGGCAPDFIGHCMDLSVCVAQTGLIPLQSPESYLFTRRTLTRTQSIPDNDVVSTRYPEILRRPPKV